MMLINPYRYAVAGDPLLLDMPELSGVTVAAAYSLRKLRDAYSGSAIRVRRSSDNAEQDIGFDGNELDTAALLAFCGAGDGFITTIYSQISGVANATNATASAQFPVVASGVVTTLGGHVCCLLTTAHVLPAAVDLSSAYSAVSMHGIVANDSANNAGAIGNYSSGTDKGAYTGSDPSLLAFIGGRPDGGGIFRIAYAGAGAVNELSVIGGKYNGNGVLTAYRNGTPGTPTSWTAAVSGYKGNTAINLNGLNSIGPINGRGYWREAVIFGEELSDAQFAAIAEVGL